MTCGPRLDLPHSLLPVRSHVCTRPALCGPHASRIVWPAITPACKPALALALAPAHERPALARAWLSLSVPTSHTRPSAADAVPTNHQPTGSTDQSRGIWRPRAPGRAVAVSPAPGRGLCPFHQRRYPDSHTSDCRLPIPGRPRACLPRLPASLQPFPPVSPERGGASRLPPAANRLSFWQPRDSFAKPRGSPTRDPARAGAAVGRCHLDVRACQVWGVGMQHRHRSLDDCPPFSLEIWGSVKRRFFG